MCMIVHVSITMCMFVPAFGHMCMDVQYMCVYGHASECLNVFVRVPACLCVWCLTGLAPLGLFWKIMYCMSGFQSA